jgi:hypothetical protein
MDKRERRNLHGQPSGLPAEGGDWLAPDGGGELGVKRTGWPASRGLACACIAPDPVHPPSQLPELAPPTPDWTERTTFSEEGSASGR